MATLDELAEAVAAARDKGCEELTLLKCTSTYPADPENTNLAAIPGDAIGLAAKLVCLTIPWVLVFLWKRCYGRVWH